MNELVALLDYKTQTELRAVLTQLGLSALETMRDETLAALALLGRQPTDLRAATLAVMPLGGRRELQSFELAEARKGPIKMWELTPAGADVAEKLAAALPAPTAAEEERARGALTALVEDAERELEARDD